MFKLLVVVVLAIIFWVLYHKIFHVIYFDAIGGLFREGAVCIILALLIVSGISGVAGNIFHPAKTKSLDYLGVYWNDALLEGSGRDTSISIEPDEENKDYLRIEGLTLSYIGEPDIYFSSYIPVPEENPFTCTDDTSGVTLTISINEKDSTLDITQKPGDSGIYAGHYLNNDAWTALSEEVRAAVEAAQIAAEPNQWIRDYFGVYVPYPVMENENRSLEIYEPRDYNSRFFQVILQKYEDGLPKFQTYEIEYPLGPEINETIEYQNRVDRIRFRVQRPIDGAKILLEIEDCNYPEFNGIFIPADEAAKFMPSELASQEETPALDDLDQDMPKEPEYSDEGAALPEVAMEWSGTYLCSNGGADGEKTLRIRNVTEDTFDFTLDHIYGDGHTDTFSGQALIGTYDNGYDFASYEEEKVLYFAMSETGVEVSHMYIYPDKDLEFEGIYTKQP